MPEDSKKNDKKNAKEQRKPRQRQQQAKVDKKPEKAEEPKSAPKVQVPQKPPVYESPPPEFYKNLKRETDEILKITEEENTKYKKKEIQSNWSKYEVPIDSYEEIDEQENLGADYEKLIEAPLSVGGHFQFKHEKSWDINTGPSQYDKYFEINMDNLNTALCTVPFYERNNIELTLFNESDTLTMNNRSTRFKQKYFNDKSYSTPEIEAQDKILNSLRDSVNNDENNTKNIEPCNKDIEIKNDSDDIKITNLPEIKPSSTPDIELKTEPITTVDSNKIIEENTINTQNVTQTSESTETAVNEEFEHDDFIFGNTEKASKFDVEKTETISDNKVKPPPQVQVKTIPPVEIKASPVIESKVTPTAPPVTVSPVESKKNPVIESPEDLEKWLDDFLDG